MPGYKRVNVETAITICAENINIDEKNVTDSIQCSIFSKLTHKSTDCSQEVLKISRATWPKNKCLTYFSSYASNYSVNDLTTETTFKIDFNKINRNVMLITHSAHDLNLLFNLSAYVSIEKGFNYYIIYDTITQMDKTNCFDYKNNWNTKFEPKSKFDCIRKCIFRKFSSLNCSLPNYYGLKTSDIFEKSSLPAFNYSFNVGIVIDHCEDLCKKECFQVFYDYRYQKRKISKQNIAVISIEANNAVHSNYKNSPKIDIWEFISNIGNIFGLWLGWNVLSIANNNVSQFFKMIFCKIKIPNFEQIYNFEKKWIGVLNANKKRLGYLERNPNWKGLSITITENRQVFRKRLKSW
jgi:hypothetical protein